MFKKRENIETKKIHDDSNKFMKILIACGADLDDLTDRVWEIEETTPHCYICSGSHPVSLRKTLKGTNIIIH